MKLSRYRKTLMAVSAALVVLVGGAGVAYAASANQVISGITNRTIYKFGNNINITGEVNGDIYCAGQTVTIDANINGDVMCAGQTVTINGRVLGDIRVAGQTVSINGTVAKNVSIAGQDISFSAISSIGRDASVAGQTISFDGPIGRDIDVGANKVYINSTVGRNANIHASEKLILQDKGSINGNLVYTSPKPLVKTGPAHIDGKVTYTKLEAKKNNGHTFFVIWRIYVLLAMTVLAVVLVALFPQQFRRWNEVAIHKTGWAFLAGFVAMIMVPIGIIMLFLTAVGAPLAILSILLWVSLVIVSFPVAYYAVGSRFLPNMHPVLMILIASLVLGILTAIPFLGGLIVFILYLFGTGIILLSLADSYKKPNYSRK